MISGGAGVFRRRQQPPPPLLWLAGFAFVSSVRIRNRKL
ncbi:hypothetical protein TIFTF001_053738 [Ficus carica]|uniref:Uncharacterized protein n=1 Tax=Ficus carica TaxID=3494 RepID=A0AA88EFG4_FICCA|nr:hypothetical protein TIFTF001_053738 [Ficus carica]